MTHDKPSVCVVYALLFALSLCALCSLAMSAAQNPTARAWVASTCPVALIFAVVVGALALGVWWKGKA